MLRLFASLVLTLLANTVGLFAASVLLSGFDISGFAFISAVLIFSAVEVVAGPLITKIALKNAPALLGGIALVTTFVGLFITNLFSDGISFDGITSWVLATLIVWLFALIASFVLPLFIFKKTLKKAKSNNG
jgi:uncharacterized membrane protein YvlD (DUF360 family)